MKLSLWSSSSSLLFYAFEVVVGVAFAFGSVLCRSWSLEGVVVCPVDAVAVCPVDAVVVCPVDAVDVCAGAVISNVVVVRDELLT